jgi:polysaccharide export outer membrane protein
MLKHIHDRQSLIVRSAAAGIACALIVLTQQTGASAQSGPQNNNQNPPQTINLRPTNNPTPQSPLITVPEDFAGLKLAPGFLLDVQVYDEPDLSAHVRVDNQGNIGMPFLKTLHVGGLTVSEAKELIENRFLREGILKNPQITIDVEQFATTSVTVMGEVQNPGKVELLAPHSLLDVIGMTGGETPLAGNTIELKHPNGSASMKSTIYHYAKGGDATEIREVMVHPGDTVIVKRAGVVYVLGAVNRPGGYAMQESGELNVAQAISLAQGLSLQAKVSALRVVQHGEDGKMIDIPISYNKIMEGKQVPLQLSAGDIVYVPVSKTKSVLGATTGLIGQTAAATIYTVKPF